MNVTAIVFSILGTWILAAILLMIVDRLNIGLKVEGFLWALVGAAAIAIVGAAAAWIVGALGLTDMNAGLITFVLALLLNALVLYIAAKISPRFTILSYPAAIVVAIVLAVLGWLVAWLGSLFL